MASKLHKLSVFSGTEADSWITIRRNFPRIRTQPGDCNKRMKVGYPSFKHQLDSCLPGCCSSMLLQEERDKLWSLWLSTLISTLCHSTILSSRYAHSRNEGRCNINQSSMLLLQGPGAADHNVVVSAKYIHQCLLINLLSIFISFKTI